MPNTTVEAPNSNTYLQFSNCILCQNYIIVLKDNNKHNSLIDKDKKGNGHDYLSLRGMCNTYVSRLDHTKNNNFY
jgi:hypothetical protein